MGSGYNAELRPFRAPGISPYDNRLRSPSSEMGGSTQHRGDVSVEAASAAGICA